MKNAQIKKLVCDERGLSTMEYAVLFVIIIVGAIALWSKLGADVADQVKQGEQAFTKDLGVAQDRNKADEGH